VGIALAILVGTAGPAAARRPGPEGCGASYWLTHQRNWEEYLPTFKVSNAWHMMNLPLAERRLTFAQALADPGRGATASRVLLRSAVTAYLNAAHEGVWYPYRRFDAPYYLRETINDAIASNATWYLRSVTYDLDAANNRNCPFV
jgi:hypothetical protein